MHFFSSCFGFNNFFGIDVWLSVWTIFGQMLLYMIGFFFFFFLHQWKCANSLCLVNIGSGFLWNDIYGLPEFSITWHTMIVIWSQKGGWLQRMCAFFFFRRWGLSWKTTAVLFLYRQMMTDPNEKNKNKNLMTRV